MDKEYYDDFYISSKEETRQQIENAAYMVEKATAFIESRLS
jgi:hypothetical protein